jgi:hypothetical protein
LFVLLLSPIHETLSVSACANVPLSTCEAGIDVCPKEENNRGKRMASGRRNTGKQAQRTAMFSSMFAHLVDETSSTEGGKVSHTMICRMQVDLHVGSALVDEVANVVIRMILHTVTTPPRAKTIKTAIFCAIPSCNRQITRIGSTRRIKSVTIA